MLSDALTGLPFLLGIIPFLIFLPTLFSVFFLIVLRKKIKAVLIINVGLWVIQTILFREVLKAFPGLITNYSWQEMMAFSILWIPITVVLAITVILYCNQNPDKQPVEVNTKAPEKPASTPHFLFKIWNILSK